MAFELLLREGQINSMRLRNRIITGPMEKGMANRDGSLTQRYIDYLVERARGGASLIQVESTYVDTRGMGHLYQVGCHGDHVIPRQFTPKAPKSVWKSIWEDARRHRTCHNSSP
jgi:2,4-dienoyl-CoA reductase-like NADH-dependent reductase (Old Yellow Enzyme family)